MSLVKLAELAGATKVLTIRGQMIEIRGMRLAQLPALLAKRPELAGAIADRNVANIVTILLGCGHEVVCELIDIACDAPAGTANNAKISATDETEILTALVSVTLPEDEERVGKLVAEVENILGRFGIKIEDLMKKADGQKSSSS